MTEIKIDNTGDGVAWLYNSNNIWKSYCGCENFDEEVVLTGNRQFCGCREAEWYKEAEAVLMDIYNYDEYPEELSEEATAKLKKVCKRHGNTDDILVDIIRILNPNDKFETGTLRGYCQSDWQNYIVKGDVNTILLEAIYFGKISDITVTTDEDEFGDIITHDELWDAERGDGLKEYFRKKYDLSDDEEIRIFQADGYKQVVDWREVG